MSSMAWRVCPRFPNYEVSECGDVRRITDSATRKRGHLSRMIVNMDGYLAVSLIDRDNVKRSVCVHRLVAEAFIGPPPGANYEVAHNNGSRVFNHYSNLRWADRKSNAEDSVEHDTSPKGMRNPRAKLSDVDVYAIRKAYREWKEGGPFSLDALAAKYNVHPATVSHIGNGKTWKHLPPQS